MNNRNEKKTITENDECNLTTLPSQYNDYKTLDTHFSLEISDLNLDQTSRSDVRPFSKKLVLCHWVKKHLVLERFSFEKSVHLFLTYVKDVTEVFGEGSTLSEKTFFKEIESIMQSYQLVVIKEQSNQSREYRGVKYCNILEEV